jgi:inosose dehydratase
VSPNRIGVAACTWGLEPGYLWVPQYDPAEVLAAAARLGFAGYEPASESGPGARVAEQAARVGLACPARFVGLSLADSDQARRDARAALDDLLALGGQMLLVGVEELGDTQPLAELADSCVHAGVTAAIHPELGTAVATADVVDKLLAVSPALAVCVDTGHFWAAGDHDLPELVRWWDRRIAHVHLKDVAAKEAAAVSAGKSVLEAVQAGLWQPLGEGAVPLAETLEVLEQQGYEGWLIVEHDFAPDPEGSAAAGLAWVEAARR